MRRCLLLGVLMALLGAANAGAVTLVSPDGQPAAREQSWVQHVYVPTVSGAVTLTPQPCPDLTEVRACVVVGMDRTIYFPPQGFGRFELLHELGHVFDRTMPAWGRDAFLGIMGLPQPWRTGLQNPPVEKFADAYANCALHRNPLDTWDTTNEYLPTRAQNAAVCALIVKVGRSMGSGAMPPPLSAKPRRAAGSRTARRHRHTAHHRAGR